ncbi:MAG: hypothetical protein ACJ77K_08485 [Bacteroidia bacterium]|jgi:hypothetical protein
MRQRDKILNIICIVFLAILSLSAILSDILSVFDYSQISRALQLDPGSPEQRENILTQLILNSVIYTLAAIVPLLMACFRFRYPRLLWLKITVYGISIFYFLFFCFMIIVAAFFTQA